MHGLKLVLALLVISLAFISCGKKHISLPKEFGIDEGIYLGQSISKLKKERDLKPIDSAVGYSEKLEGNRFFDEINYNPDIMFSFKLEPSHLKLLGLYQHCSEKDSASTDSLVAEIVNICDKYYGQHYYFPDSTNRYQAPIFIWKTDSSAVFFSFSSSKLYNKLRNAQRSAYCYYSFTISYKLDKEDEQLLSQGSTK